VLVGLCFKFAIKTKITLLGILEAQQNHIRHTARPIALHASHIRNTFNLLTPTIAIWVQLERVKPSFVIF